jgi:sugar lactone lactonase YvrE
MWQRKLLVLAIVAAMAGFATQVAIADDGSTGARKKSSVAQLVSIRSSEKMPWNAVVVDSRNRVIVSSPRWTGSVGPAVAIAGEHGELTPFPDASWNDWKPGSDASRCFVSVNAIHADANGDLWIVDTGSPDFGGSPIENGAKIVRIDPRTDAIKRVYILPEGALRTHTYVDDIRINGTHAYLTDAGEGALLVLNLEDGSVRRHFDNAVFTHARPDDKIVVNGKVLAGADGKPLKVNADPLELSPDGRVLYFGPLSGPMSQIETRYLDDESLGDRTLAEHVTPWFADMPPVGGTAMDADGSLYYTPLADNSLMRRAPDGSISTVIRDSRLRWVDAPFIDGQGNIFLPVPQIDGAPAFNHGTSTMKMPIELYRLRLPHA